MENTPTTANNTKKVSICKKLDLDISPSKISSFFTFLGVNKNVEEEFEKIKEKISSLKKRGIDKVPDFEKKCPKRLTKEQKGDKYLLERYTKEREVYDGLKDNHDNLSKTYESFASEEYKIALLAFRLKRKLEGLMELSVPCKNSTSQPKRDILIEETRKSVSNFKQEKWNKSFEDIFKGVTEIVNDAEWKLKIPAVIAQLNVQFSQTNDLFTEKDVVESKKTRFGEQVKIGCAVLAQETMRDLIVKAIGAARANDRVSVKREDFCFNIIKQSSYCSLYCDLEAARELEYHLERKEQYNLLKKEIDLSTKEKRVKGSYVASFEDTEVSGKHAKNVAGRKVWHKLNLNEKHVDLTGYIMKIFKRAKDKMGNKYTLSQHAKEYLSLLLSQFMEKLNKQIEIYLRKNIVVLPSSRKIVKEKKVSKTFDAKSLFLLIQTNLVSSPNEEVAALLEIIKEKLVKLHKFKTSKAEEVKAEEVKAEEVKAEEVSN